MEEGRQRGSTKEKIFMAAAELFAQRSYAAVSVREIADKVGIKAASIYNHYQAKEDILEEIIDYYVLRMQRFFERQRLHLREPSYRMTIRDIQFVYGPEEEQLMFWITRIVYTEQFGSRRAAEAMFGANNRRYTEGQARLLHQLYQRGIIRHKENIPIYADIMARMAQSFQTDFVHPEFTSEIGDLNDMYVYIMDMILSHEGTYERRDEVMQDHVNGLPPGLKK